MILFTTIATTADHNCRVYLHIPQTWIWFKSVMFAPGFVLTFTSTHSLILRVWLCTAITETVFTVSNLDWYFSNCLYGKQVRRWLRNDRKNMGSGWVGSKWNSLCLVFFSGPQWNKRNKQNLLHQSDPHYYLESRTHTPHPFLHPDLLSACQLLLSVFNTI